MWLAAVFLGLLPLVLVVVGTGLAGLAAAHKALQKGLLSTVASGPLKNFHQKQPRKSVSRPGQRVNRSSRSRGAECLMAEDLAELGQLPIADAARSSGASNLSHVERMERLDSNWRQGNPARLQLLQSRAKMLHAQHEQLHKQEATAVQSWLMSSWALHSCPGMPKDAADAEAAGFEEPQCRQIEYVGLHGRSSIKFPSWKCTHCQQLQQASPEAAGCFPMTPLEPNRLYSMGLLQFYSGLKPVGVSMHG